MTVLLTLLVSSLQITVSADATGHAHVASIESGERVEREEPDDVVINGYRLRPNLSTVVVPPANGATINVRQGYEWSEVVARCAARDRLSGLKWLKAVVDGEFQTVTQMAAQDRLRRIYTTCSEHPEWIAYNTIPPTSIRTGSGAGNLDNGLGPISISATADVAPLGRSIYDRGAFMIEAMKRFAPDLSLTRAQTHDPEIQARFNAREVARNRHRLPADYRYFEIAVCMVRLQPKLSVNLALSSGPARFGDIQAALIDKARVCVGNASKVTVDPTEFRIYIADAVYRWAVAAKNVSSLIDNYQAK